MASSLRSPRGGPQRVGRSLWSETLFGTLMQSELAAPLARDAGWSPQKAAEPVAAQSVARGAGRLWRIARKSLGSGPDCSGRFAKASAKAAIEVGEIAETALIRNGEDPERTRRVGKQSPGTAETMLEHMLAERLARLFQQAADVAWRHPEGLGDQVVVKGRINSPLGDCRENSAQARRLDAARCHLGGAVPG